MRTREPIQAIHHTQEKGVGKMVKVDKCLIWEVGRGGKYIFETWKYLSPRARVETIHGRVKISGLLYETETMEEDSVREGSSKCPQQSSGTRTWGSNLIDGQNCGPYKIWAYSRPTKAKTFPDLNFFVDFNRKKVANVVANGQKMAERLYTEG